MCHLFLFDTLLIQEVLHKADKKYIGDMSEEEIEKEFESKHNTHLHGFVYSGHQLFDSKDDYCTPKCLQEGALVEVKMLLKSKRTLSYLQSKKSYALSYQLFTFSSDGCDIVSYDYDTEE